MASIRERLKADGTRVFNVQVRVRGYPARTASFPTKRDAERWGKTIEAQMIEGKHFRGIEARRRTLGEAITKYLEEEVPRKRNGGMHKATLPWWRDELGHLKLADITPAVIVEKRAKLASQTYTRANPASKRSLTRKKEFTAKVLKRTPATVNRYLSCLAHVFTVAKKEWHWLPVSPMDQVSKFRESKGRTRYLANDEIERLLEQTEKDPLLHVFVVVALSTAARASDLLQLVWEDVDLTEGRLLFRITKNADPRAAWLYGDALELMKAHHASRRTDTERVFPNLGGKGRFDYNQPFAEACIAAKIANFRFHDLRHTAGTLLAMQGASEQQLKAIGGWKSGIVSRYVHIAAMDAKDHLEKLASKVSGRKNSAKPAQSPLDP